MKNLDLKDKRVAILGLGTEGLALVDFLFDKAAKITILDQLPESQIRSRLDGKEKDSFETILKNELIDKVFGDNYLDNLNQFDIVFRSPGISYFNPKIQDVLKKGVEVSSQIKLFFKLCPCPIIGVTGTKGKGTTASLISEILKKQNYKSQITNHKLQVFLAGNIGYPAITLIPKLQVSDIVILELSSFQLMDLDISPYIAVVTNLTVDHLDYHENIDEYQQAKFNILKYQAKSDFAILNKESTFSPENIDKLKSQIKYFSGQNEADASVVDDKVVINPKTENIEICRAEEIKLFGHHNLENIAAATLVVKILKVDNQTIEQVVRNFSGLPHRLEFVREIEGVKFINDSFATNPEPTMAAINSFTENKILILGGSSKGADFGELAKKISASNVSGVVLIGDEAEKINKALKASDFRGDIAHSATDMNQIVREAQKLTKKNDVVILSPACASFGLFANYKDRGDKFKTAVLNLSQR